MPYKTNADLPQAVRTALPDEAQTIFRKAFNSIAADNPDLTEERIFKQAWGAVSKAGWHAPSSGKGQWTKDAEEDAEDDDLAAPPKLKRKARDEEAFDETPGKLWAFERLVRDASFKPRKSGDGYLVAYPRVARSGIQIYSGHEVGRPDMEQVRVYRPETEVFHRDSLHSYGHKPVTNDHPPVMVDASNWREFSVGDLGEEVLRDGQFVRVPMMLMDQAAIAEYEAGKAELSLGYTMDLKWEAGTTPKGETYDAVQSHIRANHLALTDSARGGPMLRIGDSYPTRGATQMTTKQIVVDGLKVTMEERDADIILRALDKFDADMKAARKALDDANAAIKLRDDQISAAKKDGETKDAKIATLEKQLKDAEVTPERLQALVKDRAETVEKAKRLLGDKLVVDGRSIEDIRKQVVDSQLGATAKDWTPAQIEASFDSFASRLGAGPSGNYNQLDRVLGDGLQPLSNFRQLRDKAYEDAVKRSEEAWRMTPPKAN